MGKASDNNAPKFYVVDSLSEPGRVLYIFRIYVGEIKVLISGGEILSTRRLRPEELDYINYEILNQSIETEIESSINLTL